MDVLTGLDNPTPEEWDAWHRSMLALRAGFPRYDDPKTAWSDTSFRQMFLFMYDTSFFRDGRYRTNELVDEWRRTFGRIDSVLLWHAYPRLGFDERTQFDFYRDMPGGLARLRAEVTAVFHERGIKVFVDYNPWDHGSYEELAEIVAELNADGVMLDTMPDLPDALERAVPGVVFAPERRPSDDDLRRMRQSWAQWFDIGDGPSIYRHQWLVPQHRQFAIRRWDRSRKGDIVYSFFNGSGLILWENIFGSYNPYSREDRKLIAETGALFDRYEDLFARGEWLPLVPTGVAGLDANVWRSGERAIMTLRNRTASPMTYEPPEGYQAFWSPTIEPGGVRAFVRDDASDGALEYFREVSARADFDREETSLRRISIRSATRPGPSMVAIPGGDFEMVITHERRECGCWHDPGGWFYKDVITHREHVKIEPFSIRTLPVTNEEFVAFVRASSYRPADPENFLEHLVALDRQAKDPVTYVSLADARAYAAWHGQRLPTEVEWQWVAEGDFPVEQLSGHCWELTDSEWTDDHTRFVMLRGGIHLAPGESEWFIARGPRPAHSHAKYILLSDGLDRSATITFRTVA
jgi:hypothetical protein